MYKIGKPELIKINIISIKNIGEKRNIKNIEKIISKILIIDFYKIITITHKNIIFIIYFFGINFIIFKLQI